MAQSVKLTTISSEQAIPTRPEGSVVPNEDICIGLATRILTDGSKQRYFPEREATRDFSHYIARVFRSRQKCLSAG
jgi:hypothetical protein